MISYAQNFEDVMLWRAFGSINRGFYIDIGAGHPEIDSVSNLFWRAQWKGIDVEPNRDYFNLLVEERPQNLVMNCAITSKGGKVNFFEISASGLSTSSLIQKEALLEAGYHGTSREVQGISLDIIFNLCGDQEVHWLKIDIEGSEKDAIESWHDSPKRPWLILIEATLPNSQIESFVEWEPLLIRKGYEFVYFDGLNRFYIHEHHQELKKHFLTPPNFFDFFELSGKATSAWAQNLNKISTSTQSELASTQSELASTQSELASTQSELMTTITTFLNSRSWRAMRFPRRLKTLIFRIVSRDFSFLKWKIKGKINYEKRKLVKVFYGVKNFSHNNSEYKKELIVNNTGNRVWIDPYLTDLTKERIVKK